MKDRVFIDSNVLVYAHDLDADEKYQKAVEIVRNLWEDQNGVISTQVLQEFYVNVTRKIPHPLAKSSAREIARNYSLWQTETIDSADNLMPQVFQPEVKHLEDVGLVFRYQYPCQ